MLWGPENKLVIKSQDVVFFEDQTLEDLKKGEGEEPLSYPNRLIDLDPIPPPAAHDDERDAEAEHNDVVGDDTFDDIPIKDVDQDDQGE